MKILNLGSLNIDKVYSVEHFVSAGETISSSRMEPPPANSNLPFLAVTAPVKAPFSWPNSSDSSRLSGMAVQLIFT